MAKASQAERRKEIVEEKRDRDRKTEDTVPGTVIPKAWRNISTSNWLHGLSITTSPLSKT